jgi:RNA recognition motif-containing protein
LCSILPGNTLSLTHTLYLVTPVISKYQIMHVLITNLNKLTTTSQVAALLFPFGLVTSVKLVTNRRNGFSEGVAVVEMDFSAGHSAIKALNNLRFMNFFIKVEQS